MNRLYIPTAMSAVSCDTYFKPLGCDKSAPKDANRIQQNFSAVRFISPLSNFSVIIRGWCSLFFGFFYWAFASLSKIRKVHHNIQIFIASTSWAHKRVIIISVCLADGLLDGLSWSFAVWIIGHEKRFSVLIENESSLWSRRNHML